MTSKQREIQEGSVAVHCCSFSAIEFPARCPNISTETTSSIFLSKSFYNDGKAFYKEDDRFQAGI